MMRKCDVKLGLDFPIGNSISFGESEQRLVARMICERFGKRVTFREVDS